MEGGKLSVLDRLALENDMYAFFRSGIVSVDDYLNLVERFGKESAYAVWADILANLEIDALWAGDPGSGRLPEMGHRAHSSGLSPFGLGAGRQ
jgi:hypothetical protein